MRPVEQHRHEGRKAPVSVAIVTVSDSRTLETDVSGALAADLVRGAGHEVLERVVVPDEPTEVRAAVERLLGVARVVITNGGTGIAARDSTYEALAGLLEKRLDGFGELFRSLSFADVGPAAMMSRAVAGTARGGVVVVLPGSPDAVRLGLERLVLPELGHLAKLAARPARADGAPSVEASAAPTLTHLDAEGRARMVDVGEKAETVREAVAQSVVTMSPEAFAQLSSGASKKGDVLAVARIAGIQAGKRTSEIIPLCHPIALTSLAVELELDAARRAVRVLATARTLDRTGVEMEALVAASVAALTIYDMLKAVDRAMEIGECVLVRKTGGKSGDYVRGA
jgi:cyclic pyranopterin phosphate synthase